jgi:hypothetical protein
MEPYLTGVGLPTRGDSGLNPCQPFLMFALVLPIGLWQHPSLQPNW